MFHKSKGLGQPGQWLRSCSHCKWLFIGEGRDCPNCGWFAHYGAPYLYDGWIKSFYLLLKQILRYMCYDHHT
jgi:hypothetical protein